MHKNLQGMCAGGGLEPPARSITRPQAAQKCTALELELCILHRGWLLMSNVINLVTLS